MTREFQWAVQRGYCEIVSETITTGGKSITWTRQKEGDEYTDRWLSSGNPPEQREGVLTIDETGQSTFRFQPNGVDDHRVLVTKNDGTTVLEDFCKNYRLYRNKDGLVLKVDFADGTIIREYTWSKDQHGKDVVQALKISKHEKLLSTWARIGPGRYRSNTGRVWEVDFQVTDAGVHSVIHGNANTPTYRYFPDGRIEIDNKRPGESRHVVTSNGARIERVQLGSRARHVTTDEIRDEITHTKWTKQPRKGQDGTGEFVWIPSRIDDSQPYTEGQGERTGTVDLLSTGTYSFKDREGVRIVHTSDGRVIKMDQEGLRAEIERTFSGDENKQIRERLVRNLALVEKRAAIDALSYGERSEAYCQAYRLLDIRGQTGEKPFNETDRRVLFEQLIWAYAHPRMQYQGYHDTCGLTAPRACMLLKEPSVVGRVIADVVTTGKVCTKNGTVITIDRYSLEPDDEARRSWPSRHLNPRLDPIVADWPASHLDPASRGIRVERENGYGPVRKITDVNGRIYEVIPDRGNPDVIDQVTMPYNSPPGVAIPAGAVRLPRTGRYALVARNGEIRLDLENGTITQTQAGRTAPSAMVRIEQSPWPPEGQRLWLGQIFDLTAGNVAYKERFRDPAGQPVEIGTLSYGQRPRTRQEGTGERIWVLKPDGTYREYHSYPGTGEYEIPYICRQMGARRPVETLTTFGRNVARTREEFQELMEGLHKDGGFPIVLAVHTRHPPFNQRPGDWHWIPIYGYDPVQRVVYGSSNYDTANFPALRDTTGRVRSRGGGLKIEQLFTATRK